MAKGNISAGDFVKFVKTYTITTNEINSNADTGLNISVSALSNNKVFITFVYSSYLYGVVCIINEDGTIIMR